jgi:Serine endopeptidase inhibitors.
MDTKNEVPFFARYLEGQDFPEVKTDIKAGMTLKYPSDRDEEP